MAVAKDETEMQVLMGDTYHVCSECSMYCNTKKRDWCRDDRPVNRREFKDIQLQLSNLERLIKAKGSCQCGPND